MHQKGLNQSDLATACRVTREAVSQWLRNKAIPRPSKLKLLSEQLGLEFAALFVSPARPLVVATTWGPTTEPVTSADQEAFQEIGARLSEVASFICGDSLFEAPALVSPTFDENYLHATAAWAKQSIGLAPESLLSTLDLITLSRAAGMLLLPANWQGDRAGQRHVLWIDEPSLKGRWLVFGTNLHIADFESALAHGIGARYVRNALQGAEAEQFACEFARVLRSPRAARYEDPARTVERSYFGGPSQAMPGSVVNNQQVLGGRAYRAIADFQQHEGGRNPAFIMSLLNIGLGAAVELSYVLWHGRQRSALTA